MLSRSYQDDQKSDLRGMDAKKLTVTFKLSAVLESLKINSTAIRLSHICSFFYKFLLKRKYTVCKTSMVRLTNP